MSKITITESPFYLGITVDSTFLIYKDGEEIGRGGVSELLDCGMYLEWIELYPPFQNKSLLRPALLAICEYFKTDTLTFDAREELVDMYLHLGAEKGEYDDFREMQEMTLQVDALRA